MSFQAQAAKGNYKEAEETFLMIQNEKLKSDYVYISHLARCCKKVFVFVRLSEHKFLSCALCVLCVYCVFVCVHADIMNKKSQQAWELYLKMETSAESFSLLQLIANDCYKMGQFWHAAKAFDMLERLDPSPEHWEGKRGACVGVFQRIVAGQQNK